MNIRWNEYTWYSKLAAAIFFGIVLPIWAVFVGLRYLDTVYFINQVAIDNDTTSSVEFERLHTKQIINPSGLKVYSIKGLSISFSLPANFVTDQRVSPLLKDTTYDPSAGTIENGELVLPAVANYRYPDNTNHNKIYDFNVRNAIEIVPSLVAYDNPGITEYVNKNHVTYYVDQEKASVLIPVNFSISNTPILFLGITVKLANATTSVQHQSATIIQQLIDSLKI